MIRDVANKDFKAIAQIYNYYIVNSIATFEEQEVSAEEIGRRVEKVLSLKLPWIVAEEAGGMIGYAYAAPWHMRSAYRYTVEFSAYLSHHVVSKGWGTKLYQTLFDRLVDRDIHAVIGGISLPNDASVALQEKFGFEKAAHYKEVGFKFGQWIDVGYWQKIL